MIWMIAIITRIQKIIYRVESVSQSNKRTLTRSNRDCLRNNSNKQTRDNLLLKNFTFRKLKNQDWFSNIK